MGGNIGKKIKTVAEVFMWIGIIASVGVGAFLWLLDANRMIPGAIIMIVGSVISWVSGLLLCGFGQLIENTDIIVRNMNNANKPD